MPTIERSLMIPGSDCLTHRIRVIVHSTFVPKHSRPKDNRYTFTYQIRIVNEGDTGARLLRRHWVITDALGRVEEVRGDGVVGKQPHLTPGRIHDYTSVCPLETPFGTMRGTYEFERDDGTLFNAEIGEFSLIATPVLS